MYRFAGFTLDPRQRILLRGNSPVPLPPKALELLELLVESAPHVATKAEIMDRLWPDGFVEEGNLTQYVYLLRKTFSAHGIGCAIQTIPRRGYRFTVEDGRETPSRRTQRAWTLRYIAALITILLLAGATRLTAPRPALSGEALQAYSLGRYYWNLRSVAGMQRSVNYFTRVIALVPKDPRGYAALADAYTELADLETPCDACPRWGRDAKRLASQALTVDPSSVEAHVAYGMAVRVFDGDDRTAVREFQRALALDPNDPLANQWYGNLLIARGDVTNGIAHLQVAASEQPISTATYAWLARGYYYERQYADAERYAREALALEPTRLETTVLLGFAEEARGEYAAALREFTSASRLGITPEDSAALRAGIAAATGKRSAAMSVLDRLSLHRNLDGYALRDVAIGYAIAADVPAARTVLAHIRFRSRLDRELVLQDPYIRRLI